MDSLSNLLDGFGTALTPMNLVWVFVGALLGTAVGVLPGLGSAMAVALLLPVTFTLDPTAALIMFAGVYFGGLFGDSISGILMNTPGNSTAIAGTFEGVDFTATFHMASGSSGRSNSASTQIEPPAVTWPVYMTIRGVTTRRKKGADG